MNELIVDITQKPDGRFVTGALDPMSDITASLRQLEECLLDPGVRKDSAQLDSLLGDDFREFGSSGRIFNKADIIAHLQNKPANAPVLSLSNFATQILAPNVALATYLSTHTNQATGETSSAMRSSIWIRRDHKWQIHFHQGTPTTHPAS
jgi:hypothetical protein